MDIRKIGPSIRICQLNIEGISQSKSQLLHRLLKDNEIDVVCIQETHTENEEQLKLRGNLPDFDLIGATFHRFYGNATYVRSDVENTIAVSSSMLDNIHEVTIKVGDTVIVNIYKPPTVAWTKQALNSFPHPALFVGDFNSHHALWKYRKTDQNGEALMDWIEAHNLHLVFDAKDKNSFKSAAWNTESNPDLCFVTNDSHNKPLPTSRTVLNGFPHSQHRPIVIEVGIAIPLVKSFPRPRWNFGKADWLLFAENLDKRLGWIAPAVSNYKRFIGAVLSSARETIPRGYRKEYIPGWNIQCEQLYNDFLTCGDNEIADDLLLSLDASRRLVWENTCQRLDFTKSSRQAWSLLRKLGGGNKILRENVAVSPNQFAHHMVKTSRCKGDKVHSLHVKQDIKRLKKTALNQDSPYTRPVLVDELCKSLSEMKCGKAPGFDGIHSDFLLHSGKYAKVWLAKFMTNIFDTGTVPHLLKKAKVIAILKPGKSGDDPRNYRPIALLNTLYKLLERIIFNRINAKILLSIPVEQAGFRPGRNCTDQVLSLTTFIEDGFQCNLKTSVAFIDLSAAYDTVWRHGLISKLLQVIPCKQTANLINDMLSNRPFQVIMGNLKSAQMKLSNGLPQGAVLAPLLFSLYIADMPQTSSKKFGYADDWALATQHSDMKNTEETLTDDLAILVSFFRKWKLQPNPHKTEVSCFHLNNKLANNELTVYLDNTLLKFNKNPKYLGLTLDRALNFRQHLENTAAKLKTRNNILQKLCGVSWGSLASTLRISALGLVYPVAEYGAPVWLNSSHCTKVDVELNRTMRIITGTLRSTPTAWLPILSHIPPPHLRRKRALLREYLKISLNPSLPIHDHSTNLERNRLRSRSPPLSLAKDLVNNHFCITSSWVEDWEEEAPMYALDLRCITEEPTGLDLPRKLWCCVNRIRTRHGRCADSLFKWGKSDNARCDCGTVPQNIKHIIEDCPLRAYPGPFVDFLNLTQCSIDYIANLDVCL